MKVKHLMTRGVDSVAPDCSVKDAAASMKQHNVGMLPVCDPGGLKGVVTDRDIVVRLAAHGGDPNRTTVGEIMTRNPVCCYEEENIKAVSKTMEERKIRRILVLDHTGKMIGILSLDDFTKRDPGREILPEVLGAAAARHV